MWKKDVRKSWDDGAWVTKKLKMHGREHVMSADEFNTNT